MKTLSTLVAGFMVLCFPLVCVAQPWAGGPGQGPGQGPGPGMNRMHGQGHGPGMQRGPGGGPGPQWHEWWQHPEIQKKLELLPEQIEALGAVNHEAQTQSIQLDAQRKVAELSLQRAVEQDAPDPGAIDGLIDQIGEITKQQMKLEIHKKLTLKEVLAPEQLEKVEAFMSRHQGDQRQQMFQKMRERWQDRNNEGQKGPKARSERRERRRAPECPVGEDGGELPPPPPPVEE